MGLGLCIPACAAEDCIDSEAVTVSQRIDSEAMTAKAGAKAVEITPASRKRV